MALLVKKSKLPNAGKGLFTTKAISKGDKVIEYLGEVIEWKQYAERVKANKDGYLFFVSRKKCIDAWSTKQYKARYANDALGFTRVKGITNNCYYELFGDRCFVVAFKPIKAGSEIYVDYTREYWVKLRYNVRLEAQKQKEKEAAQLQKVKKAKQRAEKLKKDLLRKKNSLAKKKTSKGNSK